MSYRIGLVALVVLSGCSNADAFLQELRRGPGPFPFVGKFDDYDETITGEIRMDYLRRVSYITAQTRTSRLRCEGLGRVTDAPAVESERCLDGAGVARLQCSDGRVLMGDWRARRFRGCNAGGGTGTDSNGAKFSFSYGMSQAEAQQYLASAAAEVAGKPSYSGGPASRGGSGTGFLISDDGLVVTNHHVIDGANTIEVHQGTVIYRATVVARDAANDLAILKTELKERPLSLASARSSMRGDEVLTLGYPLTSFEGQTQKATFGRINATSGIEDDARYLQIDIPTQPGNSGGPLLNRRGEVIGVVSMGLNSEAVFRSTGALPQNVNYAVKADYITALLPASAQLTPTSSLQEMELPALVGLVENSVVRIISKP